jgi:hypothetical protein
MIILQNSHLKANDFKNVYSCLQRLLLCGSFKLLYHYGRAHWAALLFHRPGCLYHEDNQRQRSKKMNVSSLPIDQ